MADDEAEFTAFVHARSAQLQREAWVLTGDWASAQDLVQSSLATTWRRWRAVRRRDAPEVYVRRVMMRTFLGWRGRRWNDEIPTQHLPDRIGPADVATEADRRASVVAAVRALPRQQRAVVMLRYFADLSEQATAQALGCSVGTVKSHASRALRTLRADAELRAATVEGTQQ